MLGLKNLINEKRKTIVNKSIFYAQLHKYTSFTTTLDEAWQAAINGLADTLIEALTRPGGIPELEFSDSYVMDPLTSFGILEARRHRYRGVTLDMFLGLTKYFRRSFLDILTESGLGIETERRYGECINRFFDRLEIAFCLEWSSESQNALLEEMGLANRTLANDKNQLLAVFESIPSPVIIVNPSFKVEKMNRAAHDLIMEGENEVPYFSQTSAREDIREVMPWLAEELLDFATASETEITLEKGVIIGRQAKTLVMKFHKLGASISELGILVVLTDLTESRQAENTLRYMSFHDSLTGLFNRAYFEQEMLRLGSGRFEPIGVISFDVDGLKLVNDALGHQAGDCLLITAASVIRSCFRENDVVARIGGDEFAVILPNSPAEVVERAAQRMREAVEHHNREHPLLPLSISQGWAVRHDLSVDLGRIYQEADYQMYQEKPWNREEFQQRFFKAYKEHSDDLYKCAYIMSV